MTEEQSEKLTFGELMAQFESAKIHFVNSQREVLLGFREICRILVDLSQNSAIGMAGDFPIYVIKAVGAIIDYFLARVPEHGAPEDILAAKVEAIDELIAILDEEIQRIGKNVTNEIDLAKFEAVQAIKKYMVTEREAAQAAASDPDYGRRIRKVVIE